MKLHIALLITAVALAGCANPYTKYYIASIDAKAMPSYVPVTGPTKVYSTTNFVKDADALVRQGYAPVGHADFNAASNKVSESQLLAQAKTVGAAVVLSSTHYTHTVSGAMPLTLPNTTMSYTSGTATAYGAGGTVNAYGNSTTTTYGTQTTMIPYSISRSDFGALFFVKTRTRAGIITAPIDDATRKRLGTNSGVIVRLVVDGSPGFLADILPGDVLLSVNDEKVRSPDQYAQLLTKYEGQTVGFHLDRDGQSIDKSFRIASYNDAPE